MPYPGQMCSLLKNLKIKKESYLHVRSHLANKSRFLLYLDSQIYLLYYICFSAYHGNTNSSCCIQLKFNQCEATKINKNVKVLCEEYE